MLSIYQEPTINNQHELAELYTASDVFVNPTREEVLGMTNIEALACGTYVLTFDTGGSPETIDECSGLSIRKNDVQLLTDEIRKWVGKPKNPSVCVRRAEKFNQSELYLSYLHLYNDLQKF